jgi:hypothetical protein
MFGKRRAALAAEQTSGARARSQQAPQQKVFRDELWEGEIGSLLRQIGMSPDDESNLVPTGASIDERIARDRARHEAKLADINREVAQRLPGARVMPFFLIPEPCWNGDMGTFFMGRLAFFPYDDWNVLFLPADERTASVMNLPVCPRGEIEGVIRIVQQMIAASEARLDAARAEAERTHDFAAFGAAVDAVKADVWGLASYLANHIGAQAAWKPTR